MTRVKIVKKPNIVYFLVDDMGYGDVSCLNPDGKIMTPRADRFAKEGMMFTDAHSSSAVCSPSRYSVLTGRYNWRSRLQQGIVHVFGDALIDKNRLTVPEFMRSNGYHTGCIGKWHLGMSWDFEVTKDIVPEYEYDKIPGIAPAVSEEQKKRWNELFSQPVKCGPNAAGFDYYYGVDVPNWPPYCFIENDHTTGVPTEWLPARLLGNNLASVPGPAMPDWNFENLLPTFADKADQYIREQVKNEKPFFLYLPMTSPHTPLSVNQPWIGKSSLNNAYADLVIETDDVFGRVLDSLEKYHISDNTLVIFTSDNGCAHYIGTDQMEKQGHFASGIYRGYKSDAWDGGHRIPFIARWPDKIKAGSTCSSLVCLSDLFATCAAILEQQLPDNAGEDSISMLPLFMDEKTNAADARDCIVHHSINGKFAIREHQWKLVLCPGSGGWTKDDAAAYDEGLPLVQLYNMQADPGEKNNLCKQYPEQVKRMVRQLEKLVEDGRSTKGSKQSNDVPVDIWKLNTLPGIDAAVLDDY